MTNITERRLEELLRSFQSKTVAVIGDVMLDRYLWGNVSRISPEAPVPIVEVESESARLGGAANVAHNIQSLGGKALLVGVVGRDSGGESLLRLMEEEGFSTDGIVRDSSRPTTVKTRIIAHSQHVVRIDRESRTEISTSVAGSIVEVIGKSIKKLDAVILEDYNKGVITADLIDRALSLANKGKKIVAVDPKVDNFFAYGGVTVFKPNKREVEKALNRKLENDSDVRTAGQELLKRLKAENVLITQGEKGMTLFERTGKPMHVAARARNVADVSGAGDTVISTLTLALAGGASTREACMLANFAGGIVCGEVGVVPINRKALREAVLESTDHASPHAGGS